MTDETPLFVKCSVCDHYVHPDAIQKFAATGEFVCDGCEKEYIEKEGLIIPSYSSAHGDSNQKLK